MRSPSYIIINDQIMLSISFERYNMNEYTAKYFINNGRVFIYLFFFSGRVTECLYCIQAHNPK